MDFKQDLSRFNNLSIMDKLEFGKVILAKKFPYYKPLLSMSFQENMEIPTACIDANLKVMYNGEFIKTRTFEEAVHIIMHEAMHYLLGHHKRHEKLEKVYKGLSNKLHNMAEDIEVNAKIDLPEQMAKTACDYRNPNIAKKFEAVGIDAEALKKMCYEEIIQALVKDDDLRDSLEVELSGTQSLGDIVGGCDDEQEQRREQKSQECEASATGGTNIGNGTNQNIVIAKIKPRQYKWDDLFRNLVLRYLGDKIAGYEENTYAKMNAKMNQISEQNNVIFPGKFDYEVKIRLAIVMDVSGSMGNIESNTSTLNIMYSTLKGIKNNISDSLDMDILETDTNVLRVLKNFKPEETNNYSMGGGTDMEAAALYMEEHKMDYYDLIVCMTDNEVPWSGEFNRIFNHLYKGKFLVMTTQVSKECPYKQYWVKF